MRYMLWMIDDGSYEPGPEEIEVMPEFVAWEEKVAKLGVGHAGVRLRPRDAAVTVRVRGGERLISDGPFADTKEHIGGYEVIDATDLDQAIEVAAAHPAAHNGVEIRPFRFQDGDAR
jgi:hypothetical protein